MDFVITLLPYIINGLSLGLLFALIALGFMLIIGVMELINLAHGSLFALGAYLAMVLIFPHVPWLGAFGQWYLDLPIVLRYALAIVLAPALVSVVGMILEVCMRPTYGKDPLYGLLLTFGAALVLEESIRVVWGSAEQTLQVPPAFLGPLLFGGMIYSKYQFFASSLAIIIILLVWLFLERTPYGAIIKAGAHDSEMVRALGINLRRLRFFVFGFGASLAAVAGIIMSPIWGLRPHVGGDAVIPAFLIITLGGVGSFWGAVIAGVLVGLAVGITAGFASEWSLLSMYLLLIAVVTVRARGLFGKKSILED